MMELPLQRMFQGQQIVSDQAVDRHAQCRQQKGHEIWALLKLDVAQILSGIFKTAMMFKCTESMMGMQSVKFST